MAIVKQNSLLEGISGRFGDVVYKVLRGKTLVTRVPKKSTSHSELQRGTRTKFKEASSFAKAAMLDAERKAYYQKKALKLNLPNAYTAALTDYMRKPKVDVVSLPDKSISLHISKKDFDLKKVMIRNSNADIKEANPKHKVGVTWIVGLDKMYEQKPVTICIEDVTGQSYQLPVSCYRYLATGNR